jgi:SpoIID/LytB domain protein
MCQYGAYGMAKMGVRYADIIKHYYTGVEVARAY